MKVVRNYVFVILFCILFGGIYEHFSFGVYSNFMIYAFAWPFVFGLIPALLLAIRSERRKQAGKREADRKWPERLWHTGIATLTVGSIFKGILDIYGTDSVLTIVYWIVGGALLLIGLASTIRSENSKRQNEKR